MTRHYPDLGSTFDWLKQISHAARPIRSTTQIWVVNVISMEFLACFSDVIMRGNQWWRREMSAVFRGSLVVRRRYFRSEKAVDDDCSLFYTIYVSGRLFFQEENRNIVFNFECVRNLLKFLLVPPQIEIAWLLEICCRCPWWYSERTNEQMQTSISKSQSWLQNMRNASKHCPHKLMVSKGLE